MLETIRVEINTIDEQITRLLEKRMTCVDQVVQEKRRQKLAVHDSSRENFVLDAVASHITNPDYQESILATYRHILAQSRDFQNKRLSQD